VHAAFGVVPGALGPALTGVLHVRGRFDRRAGSDESADAFDVVVLEPIVFVLGALGAGYTLLTL